MAKKKAKQQLTWHSSGVVRAFVALLLVVLALSTVTVFAARNNNPTSNGFDELGYNRSARIFQGPADGTDGSLNGNVWGDPTYANDKLKMKWNSEWDRGNDEGWSNPPYEAWIDNNWNGKVKNGSGEVWHYRIKWVGDCGTTGTVLADGSYCIWGQFAVVLSHGTIANQHFWDAHATPAGFGN